jgi:hypothetical protein
MVVLFPAMVKGNYFFDDKAMTGGKLSTLSTHESCSDPVAGA